jgi:hypothetical protein
MLRSVGAGGGATASRDPVKEPQDAPYPDFVGTFENAAANGVRRDVEGVSVPAPHRRCAPFSGEGIA